MVSRPLPAASAEAGLHEPGDRAGRDRRPSEATLKELDRHPIDLAATKAFSSASVSKAYLRQMGITPPSKKFDIHPELLGRANSMKAVQATDPDQPDR